MAPICGLLQSPSLCRAIFNANGRCGFEPIISIQKIPGNLDAWKAEHNTLLLRRKDQLIGDGFRVYVEAQNGFTLPSKDGRTKIGGRPDLVAVKSGSIVIEDCKTSLPKNTDLIQLLIYMHLAPVALSHCRGNSVSGRLVYPEKTIEVPISRVNDEFTTTFRQTVGLIGGDSPPPRAPSPQECNRCDISAIYCEDRIEAAQGQHLEHDLF